MKESPNRSIVLVTDLPLEFSSGEGFLRAGKQGHRYEPVSERKLGAVHDCVRTKALPVMAALALITLLVALPVMDYAAAYGTYDTYPVSVALPCCLAARFVGILLHEFYYLHNIFGLGYKAKINRHCAKTKHI